MKHTRKDLQTAADTFQARGDAALKLVIDLKPDALPSDKAINEANRREARLNHMAEVALRRAAEYLP